MLGQGLTPHMTTTPGREIIAAKHMGRRRIAVFREQTDPPFFPKDSHLPKLLVSNNHALTLS